MIIEIVVDGQMVLMKHNSVVVFFVKKVGKFFWKKKGESLEIEKTGHFEGKMEPDHCDNLH